LCLKKDTLRHQNKALGKCFYFPSVTVLPHFSFPCGTCPVSGIPQRGIVPSFSTVLLRRRPQNADVIWGEEVGFGSANSQFYSLLTISQFHLEEPIVWSQATASIPVSSPTLQTPCVSGSHPGNHRISLFPGWT
jgi:hypothetical protein